MNIIKQIILLPIAIVVFSITSIVGILYTTGKHIYKGDYSLIRQFGPVWHALIMVFDGFANAAVGEMFNDTMLKIKKNGELYKNTYKYGKWYDTISAVTGVNEKRGLLNDLGLRLTALLSFALGPRHSVEAIEENRIYK